jgi:integrase
VGDHILGRVNGRFYVRWKDGTGRWQRRSLGTDDSETAKARLGEYVRQIEFQQHAGENLTVAAIWASYVRDRESEGKVAVPRMKDAWKRLEPTFGALLPAHVNKALCRSYLADRRRAGASDGTIHVELGYLRAAMRHGKREGFISTEPVVVLPRKPPPREHHLTRDEVKRLIEAAYLPHVRLFIILAISTAGRASAILDLTWSRINFDRRTIALRDPERSETAKGRATVPINDMALEALTAARRGAVGAFVIEWGGKRVGSVKKAIASAARLAGVIATPHVLRHTAAVFMAENRVPMAEIAQFLGHRDSRTTERVYARFSPDYLRGAADALEIPGIQFSLVRSRPRRAKVVRSGRGK